MKYSCINGINEILNKYFEVYTTLAAKREGCVTPEIFEKINNALVKDFNRSIKDLVVMSKKSRKYLKKIDKQRDSRIFMYMLKRKLFKIKINETIEKEKADRDLFRLTFARIFEDVITSSVRRSLTQPELPQDIEEPVTSADKLFTGPSEVRPLHGEVLNDTEITSQLNYENMD